MKKIIILMCATALLSSCHIYKSYDRPEDITVEGLYRDTIAGGDTLAADTANFGNLPWKEVFTDAQLQTLIEQALTNNADLRSAALTVKQAQAALMSARLAYAPMLAEDPTPGNGIVIDAETVENRAGNPHHHIGGSLSARNSKQLRQR